MLLFAKVQRTLPAATAVDLVLDLRNQFVRINDVYSCAGMAKLRVPSGRAPHLPKSHGFL